MDVGGRQVRRDKLSKPSTIATILVVNKLLSHTRPLLPTMEHPRKKASYDRLMQGRTHLQSKKVSEDLALVNFLKGTFCRL